MKHVPALLLYCRPIIISILLYLMATRDNTSTLVLSLITIALLADIFDGIIARRLNISTTKFRVLDTVFDLFFYATVLLYVYQVNPRSLKANSALLGALVALEQALR